MDKSSFVLTPLRVVIGLFLAGTVSVLAYQTSLKGFIMTPDGPAGTESSEPPVNGPISVLHCRNTDPTGDPTISNDLCMYHCLPGFVEIPKDGVTLSSDGGPTYGSFNECEAVAFPDITLETFESSSSEPNVLTTIDPEDADDPVIIFDTTIGSSSSVSITDTIGDIIISDQTSSSGPIPMEVLPPEHLCLGRNPGQARCTPDKCAWDTEVQKFTFDGSRHCYTRPSTSVYGGADRVECYGPDTPHKVCEWYRERNESPGAWTLQVYKEILDSGTNQPPVRCSKSDDVISSYNNTLRGNTTCWAATVHANKSWNDRFTAIGGSWSNSPSCTITIPDPFVEDGVLTDFCDFKGIQRNP